MHMRYKALLRSCPFHDYSDYTQISMFIKETTDEYRRMISALAEGYYVNGRGRDCNRTSPNGIHKEDIKDESLKQQTQMKAMMEAMMENVTKSIVKKFNH